MANELAGKGDGSVLVCGSAPCLQADYAAALRARPNAAVIALNDAASVVFADYLVTLHPEDAHKFRANSKNPNIIVLSGQIYNPQHDVNFWFDDCNSGGTSAGSAIKVAKAMGFEEIILCGCPMQGGDGYFDRAPKRHMMAQRIGDAPSNASIVLGHQQRLEQEAAASDYSMVKSMSGWTAELFGVPAFIKQEAA